MKRNYVKKVMVASAIILGVAFYAIPVVDAPAATMSDKESTVTNEVVESTEEVKDTESVKESVSEANKNSNKKGVTVKESEKINPTYNAGDAKSVPNNTNAKVDGSKETSFKSETKSNSEMNKEIESAKKDETKEVKSLNDGVTAVTTKDTTSTSTTTTNSAKVEESKKTNSADAGKAVTSDDELAAMLAAATK